MALLPIFLFASYSSAQILSVKNLPENIKNSVIKANSLLNIIRMNPEIPFEENAFLITTNTAYMYGVPPGSIVVLSPGNQTIPLRSQSYSGKVFLDFSFEPGKYYHIEIDKISRREFKPNFVVLTDVEKLEIAKQETAKMKENSEVCSEYLEYSKQHPNVLDGTYSKGVNKIVIKDNRLSWGKEMKEMGISYDGETIILLGDRANNAEMIMSNIWYYRFKDDGNLEIILNTYPIIAGNGFVNSWVYKPVSENPSQQ